MVSQRYVYRIVSLLAATCAKPGHMSESVRGMQRRVTPGAYPIGC